MTENTLLTKGVHASCDIDTFSIEIIGELWPGNEQAESKKVWLDGKSYKPKFLVTLESIFFNNNHLWRSLPCCLNQRSGIPAFAACSRYASKS